MGVTIERAYCWEMQKIVTTYQARVAYFSKSNEYDEFNFYCELCGIPLGDVNVTSRRVLNFKINRTPHFSLLKNQPIKQEHKSGCKFSKVSTLTTATGKSKKTSSPSEEFYYTHFLLNPLETGIVPKLSTAPSFLTETFLETANVFVPTYSVEQTSILMDIVDCYQELKKLGKADKINLKIDDSALVDRTYAQTFKSFNYLLDYFDRRNENVVKYRIYHGKVLNNSRIKVQDETYWSFYIRKVGKLEWNDKPLIFEIRLPLTLLDSNVQMKKLIEKELDKGHHIDECFIVNTKPSDPIQVPNKENPEDYHYKVEIVVDNLDYIVFTFNE